MARNLLRAGDEVRAWNRTQKQAEALADEGAEVVRTAPEVVRGAEFVLTMLADGEAVEETMIESRTLDAIPEDAVWIQSADTLGLDPQRFLEAISGGGSNMEYAHIKDQLMLNQDLSAIVPAQTRSQGRRPDPRGCGRRARAATRANEVAAVRPCVRARTRR
jgi:3-hydroxyisobutyrate dehydrogenase-like beta-hydroxyacid dehydrogenase